MKDRLMEEAQSFYQKFKDARAENDLEKSRTAAREILAAIARIRSDAPSAMLIRDLAEHARKIGIDAAWQEETERELRQYLERNG